MHCHGFRRRSFTHSPNLRRILTSTRHPQTQSCRKRSYRLLDEEHDGKRDCQTDQGENISSFSQIQCKMQKSSNSSEIETNYTLSVGQVILDGNGRFWCPDALFNGMEFMRQQKEFQQKVLSGGTSMYSGINTRIEKEMIQLAQKQ